MKKADLLANIAILLTAIDHVPDDTDIKTVFIHNYGPQPVSVETTNFLPPGEIRKRWFIKGESIMEEADAFGVEFSRRKNVEMVMP